MRTLRNVITFAIPVAGMVLVLGAVLFAIALRTQLIMAVVGLLLVEGGVWRIAGSILPNERRYLALRAEGDRFIALIRQLNAAAVSLHEHESNGARLAIDETRSAMHRSVERMVAVAGRPAEELPPDAPIELPAEDDGEGADAGATGGAVAAATGPPSGEEEGRHDA